eukprot:7379849-Prymnesium_polylepis.1
MRTVCNDVSYSGVEADVVVVHTREGWHHYARKKHPHSGAEQHIAIATRRGHKRWVLHHSRSRQGEPNSVVVCAARPRSSTVSEAT